MRSFEDASYNDVVRTDPFDLNDREVRSLIVRLSQHREQQLENVTPSVNALNERIELAHRELAIRSSGKLAKIAISIATLSLLVTAISVVGSVVE